MRLLKKIFVCLAALVLLIGFSIKNYTKDQSGVEIDEYIDRTLKFQEKKPELIARARILSLEKHRLEMEAVKKETKLKKEETKTIQKPKPSPPKPDKKTAPSEPQIVKAEEKKDDTPKDDFNIPTNHQYEYLNSIEDEIIRLCNIEREKAGLAPLVLDETLKKTARYKADEMLQYEYFNHESPVSGFNPSMLAASFGYSFRVYGENIWMGKGYEKNRITAEKIVEGWMNSDSHRENILCDKYGKIGVGVVFSQEIRRTEAVQEFSN